MGEGGSLYPSQQRPGSQCAHFRFWGSGLRKIFIHFRFGTMNENYAPRDIHGTLPKLAHSKSTIRSAIARRATPPSLPANCAVSFSLSIFILYTGFLFSLRNQIVSSRHQSSCGAIRVFVPVLYLNWGSTVK